MRYYEVRTANTTYHLRADAGRIHHDGIRRGAETDAWGGRFQFFTLAGTEMPRVGEPMRGQNATGRIQTSPVQSIRRIGLREFARANA
jgi:hypothetical protein